MTKRHAIAFLLGTTAVAFLVRLLVAPEGGGLVDVDGDLHLRRAMDVVARGPGTLFALDRMIAWPQGAHVNWPPGFDLMLSALLRMVGAARFETAAAVAIPALGALAVPVAYQLARAVLDRSGACVVAAVTTIVPAHIELTRRGRIDHHVLEPTLVWWSAAWLLGAVAKGSAWRAAASGAALTLLFACSPTALLGAVVFGGMALSLAQKDERIAAIALAAAAAGMLLLALVMGTLRKLSVDEVSALQPMLFAGAAVGVLVSKRRTLALAGVGIAVAVVALMAARGGGAFMLAGRQGLAGTILESRGLFAFGAFAAFAPLTPLAFLLPVAAWFTLRRHGATPARLTVCTLAIAFLALAIVQRRFMHLCAAPIAIAMTDAVMAFAGRARTALVGAALAIALPLPAIYLSHSPPGSARDAAVREIAPLLQKQPAGAVLAQWPLGHILARLGGHPVVASPLLTPETDPAAITGTRMLLDEDPAHALSAMDALGVRYLVATALSPSAVPRYLAALDDRRAPKSVLEGALVARLARDDGNEIAGLRELVCSSDGRAKLFERVKGVTVEGTVRPAGEVEVSIGLFDPNALRRFVIRLHAHGGSDGRFRVNLPYPTQVDETSTLRPGRWSLVVEGGKPKFLDVSLDDVRKGSTVMLR